MTPDERLDRYARLAVEVAVNLQPGQFLRISAEPEHLPLVRAIGRVAYERGARYVETHYRDGHLKRARVQHAPEDSLDWTPPWTLSLLDHMIETGGATIAITGEAEPELLADLDQRRTQRTRARLAAEKLLDAENRRLIQWTIVGYPNEGWAQAVFGEPDVERLWDAVITATRLDEPDPVAAWQEHIGRLRERAALLDERRFRTLRFTGPGTDLRVGLDASHHWLTGAEESVDGVPHLVNVPTEEVFTTPDRRLTEGTVRSTFPLALGGTIVRGLELRFEAGKIVEVRAETGADAAREEMATDDGRELPRRGRARRRRLARPADGRRLPRHALRRERRLARRLGPGHPDRPRRRREPDERRARGARLQRLDRPHGLHDRRPGGDGRRRRGGRRGGADHRGRRVGAALGDG